MPLLTSITNHFSNERKYLGNKVFQTSYKERGRKRSTLKAILRNKNIP